MTATVLLVLHDPAVGGATRAVLGVLPRLEREGWRFAFWVPRPSAVADLLEGQGRQPAGEPRHIRYSLAALRTPPGPWPRLRSIPGYLERFRRFVRELDPDLVHANTILTMPEALAARSAGAPTLLHVHEMVNAGPRAGVAVRLAHLLDGVAGVSRANAAPLRRRGVEVAVVTAGIDSRAPAPGGGQRPVVGMLGTVSRRKGSDLFVAAVEDLQARGTEAEFRMVGPLAGGREEAWARAVVARGARRGVHWSTTADPLSEISSWDILVHPSRQDPFPLAVLEAMAVGLPVVATAVDGIPEQLQVGSGVLVAPEDPAALAAVIEPLLADPARRAALGRAAAERVAAHFTPERHARELTAAYRMAMEAASRRRAGRAAARRW